MTSITLHAAPRSEGAGALAAARAEGLLPLTITDIRGKKLRRHAAVLDRAAFLSAWEQRSRYQAFTVVGLEEPLTSCITTFNYCPVSHVVIHVLATTYTPAQYHVLPITWASPSPALPTAVPALCRGTVPATLTLAARTDGSVPTHGECTAPAGVTLAGHEQDRIGSVMDVTSLPSFERRPGR